MEKVSVIIPVYKVEQYLDRCVESVVNQTYQNLEIILVDDGSPDNCPKMCDDWAKKDKRIKVIHKENGGVSSARNRGLEECFGEYVYFCDSDDFIETECIGKLVEKIRNNDVVIMGYNKVSGDNVREVRYDSEMNKIEFISKLVHEWDFGLLWNKIYKKELVKFRFNEGFKIREDLLFNSEYFKNVREIGIIEEPLYNYIDNPKSLTKGAKVIPIEQLKTIHLNMIDMLKNFDDKIIFHQNTAFLKSLINLFKPFVYSKMSKEEKNKIIENLNDEIVQEALKKYKVVDIKEKVFIFLLKHKMIKALLVLIKIMR